MTVEQAELLISIARKEADMYWQVSKDRSMYSPEYREHIETLALRITKAIRELENMISRATLGPLDLRP